VKIHRHKITLSIYKFHKIEIQKTVLFFGRKSNYIYVCTVKPDDITTVKKVLVKTVHCIRVYTISSLVEPVEKNSIN
jgi:hypothetical protein